MRGPAAGTLLAGALAALLPLCAGAAELDDGLMQGSLVIGRTPPGTTVYLDGRRLRVSPAGHYVLGFGRDAPERAEVRFVAADGALRVRWLRIGRRDYHVQRVDGLPPETVAPDPETLARVKREGALIAAARRHDAAHVGFISGFRWPVAGRVTGVFGSRRILNGAPGSRHRGVDIAAPAGTPVLAAADGRVAMAHPGMVLTGSTVMLDHGHGLMSVYAHLDAIRVRGGRCGGPGRRDRHRRHDGPRHGAAPALGGELVLDPPRPGAAGRADGASRGAGA